MKYQVSIAGRIVEVDLSGSTPRIDGEAVAASLVGVPGTPLHHLLMGGASYPVMAVHGAGVGVWRLTIDGIPVEAEALDERTRAIRAMTGTAEAAIEKSIVAPMPGLVVQVRVEPGQQVTTGQGIVIVEAMKMENELKAPADGVVARVEVAQGQAVEKGALLVIIE